MRTARSGTGVALWLAGAVAATAAGMFAVGAIGTDIFGPSQRPLSQSEVDGRLARPAHTSPAPPQGTTSPTSPTTTTTEQPAAPTPVTTAGGTVLARCAPGDLVQVLAATPAQGFERHSDDSADEPDDDASVKFRSGEREIEIHLRCTDGRLTHSVDDDD